MSTDTIQDNQPPAALSELLQNFLGEYRHGIDYDRKATVSPIEVDQLASKLAKFYEKFGFRQDYGATGDGNGQKWLFCQWSYF